MGLPCTFLVLMSKRLGCGPMGLEDRARVQRCRQQRKGENGALRHVRSSESIHRLSPMQHQCGGLHLLFRLHSHRSCSPHTSAAADSSANAGPHSGTDPSATDPSADACATDTSTDACATGPVLHWSRRGVQCPLLFGRVVWHERIQLRGLRWQLVRRLFTDASSTNTGEPNSDTSSSDASSSRPKCVLLRSRVHRQLRCRWMVRWERGQLRWLRGRVVQFSRSAHAQLHDEASEGPYSMSQRCWLALKGAAKACAWWVAGCTWPSNSLCLHASVCTSMVPNADSLAHTRLCAFFQSQARLASSV